MVGGNGKGDEICQYSLSKKRRWNNLALEVLICERTDARR